MLCTLLQEQNHVFFISKGKIITHTNISSTYQCFSSLPLDIVQILFSVNKRNTKITSILRNSQAQMSRISLDSQMCQAQKSNSQCPGPKCPKFIITRRFTDNGSRALFLNLLLFRVSFTNERFDMITFCFRIKRSYRRTGRFLFCYVLHENILALWIRLLTTCPCNVKTHKTGKICLSSYMYIHLHT